MTIERYRGTFVNKMFADRNPELGDISYEFELLHVYKLIFGSANLG